MTSLQHLLAQFREQTLTQRDKGTAFEKLMMQYFQHEPMYRSQYSKVQMYSDWAEEHLESLGLSNRLDTGIDLIATTPTGEFHAIQCKNYDETATIQKSDIDSFFTASGKRYFTYRIVVSTTDKWSKNAEDALVNQNPPVAKITLQDLENSLLDWSQYQEDTSSPKLKQKKELRSHQKDALTAVERGFQTADRGKLIMACGTGKTFTSLKIAEKLTGKGKKVLFLVPSLSLLSQTLREWTQDSEISLTNFAVCSDSDVGKNKNSDDDRILVNTSDLQFPATTNAKSLANAFVVHQKKSPDNLTVIYSTYHSIDVIHQAQTEYGLPAFDLIICDEAHRTTGATFDGEDESAFIKIHDANYIHGAKRLYMTATPRIYGENAKATEGVVLYSMDDSQHYGENFFVLNFSEAVQQNLLVDYKVIVLAIEEAHIHRYLPEMLRDTNNQLNVDDAAKIVGCWKALSKYGLEEAGEYSPMQRAVAFCQVIEKQYRGKKHKVSSKLIAEMFSGVVEEYQKSEITYLRTKNPDAPLPPQLTMHCEASHVDGSMNAGEKESQLAWLKAADGLPDNTCRILSNVRCLSEGVDVPALDAVLFLTPRNSQVDVVQSVGRVMRKAPGKERGYVILPVVIPAGVDPAEALDKNENYRVVWQVLNALRAHDDRFDAMINKLQFNGKMPSKMEVIAVADKVAAKAKRPPNKGTLRDPGGGSYGIGEIALKRSDEQLELHFEIGEIERALYAKIVKKCGNRHHWEDWANDVAKIAQTHIERIKAVLGNPNNTKEIQAFNAFASELRDDLNNSITDDEIIEMLAQHLITKPVFDALFAQYNFTEHNPMSIAMQGVLDLLQEQHLEKERKTLESFYESVKMRASGIETAEGKQKIVTELYDTFFRKAFPRMTERLGIVYTPIQVVDFIIHSVEYALQKEFNSSLADKGVHILDPFTGTGTFITRLLQSGIIPTGRLPEKYQNEIHANEIVLLAYYIAAINIEATYHGILYDNSDNQTSNSNTYVPFKGICLTDTFQMYEKEDLVDQMLVENSNRRKRQKSLDIRVIIGNPPYSAGQESANDNNANIEYPHLDNRIRETYTEHSKATNKNALYDSYIRAIRWASDRIAEKSGYGVIGFVTNAGWIEANTADGLRKCLKDEFSSLYIFHLRGNARTSGERRRKEKDNIFGQGTRTPIAISILVKNPDAEKQGQIYFHDIGDYLTCKQKLEIIAELGSINGISQTHGWQNIIPDSFNDWLNQRDPNFDKYISLGDKKDKDALVVFENYSRGAETGRDAWCYNYSSNCLAKNIKNMIEVYNYETKRFQHVSQTQHENSSIDIDSFVNSDDTQISWTSSLKTNLQRGILLEFNNKNIVNSMYRPYSKQKTYFNGGLTHRVGQLTQMYPNTNLENQIMYLSGTGNSGKDFSAVMTDVIPDLNMQHSGGQGFPMNLYEDMEDVETAQHNYTTEQCREFSYLSDRARNEQNFLRVDNGSGAGCATASEWTMLSDVSLRDRGGRIMSQQNLFEQEIRLSQGAKPSVEKANKKLVRRSAITDDALKHFQEPYQETITKEDVFYYIYGLLHSEEYRERYADNLSKQLPRIPRMKNCCAS